MKPISNEKRALIIEAKQRGEKDKDISLWLMISISSIGLIWRLFQRTNSIEPKPYPGRKPIFTDEMKNKVRQKIKECPDITLAELIDELELPIQKSRLSQWLIGEGLTYKKKRSTQKSSLEKTCSKSEMSGAKNSRH